MKYLFLFISLFYITIAAKAQQTTNTQLPPVRTTDNVQPQLSKVAPVIPVLASGNASAPKTPASVPAVPVRKSDLAATTQPASTAIKGTDGNPASKAALQLPSSISGKQAMEQRQKQDTARTSSQ